jgi:hypothetical protein
MMHVLLGAGLGAWVVWRWRSDIERYVAPLLRVRTKAADVLEEGNVPEEGKEKLKDGLRAAHEAVRPAPLPGEPGHQPIR